MYIQPMWSPRGLTKYGPGLILPYRHLGWKEARMGRKMVVLVAITAGFVVGGHGGVAVFADELKAPQAIPEVLTLEKAMELALSNHPSLRVASGTQAINEALVGQAQSGFYPQVQGTVGKTLTQTNSTTQFSGSSVPRSTSGKTTGFYQNSG